MSPQTRSCTTSKCRMVPWLVTRWIHTTTQTPTTTTTTLVTRMRPVRLCSKLVFQTAPPLAPVAMCRTLVTMTAAATWNAGLYCRSMRRINRSPPVAVQRALAKRDPAVQAS